MRGLALLPGILLAMAAASSAAADPEALTAALGRLACTEPAMPATEMAAEAGAAESLAEESIARANEQFGWRRQFRAADGAVVEVTRLEVMDAARISVDYSEPPSRGGKPLLTATVGENCAPVGGRRIVYDSEGNAVKVRILDDDLAPTGDVELLNPAVPPGSDPSGITVAFVDTGVNYLLPRIAAALARDSEDKALGYDYWDLDDRPFDVNTARSPFFPARHGTRVASVLLGEAPATRLLVYRYPAPAPERMTDLLDAAAGHGARVVAVTVTSSQPAAWQAFGEAAARHPDLLLVVSAGKDGRNIDNAPVYPASLDLPNMIVATGADGFGAPLPGANWGAGTVDLLVPAEAVPVIEFDGSEATASGPDLAAARVAALAVRLLEAEPDLDARGLRDAILGRASMIDAVGPLWVAYGLLDPTTRL